MSDIQNIEIERYQDNITEDIRKVVEKYREIMAWDVPDNDTVEADRLIFQAIYSALAEIEKSSKESESHAKGR
ncbi:MULTISPECIES: hypothetical protein [Shewanella]|uniref:Uncharacterized protein n=2 Tax=Shewanella psychromarinicola TaxID=2487742 RepID=A0A3N4EBL6_9GAMM|nr:hypothetical protein [Shewanella psychromarinicola]AZG36540.1 hypothetical protein EGC80_17865 [Shewanella psychromarinicola]MCL1083101.1 hypothetical protein [Shewanella psychromarinicola]RPA34388.1 hypothetical protein EGC77_01500 [Shewanella psychromarinicola]